VTSTEQSATQPGQKTPWWVWVILAIVIVILLLSAYGEDPKVKQRISDGTAIERCWKEYERRSLAPDEKRFIAASCEKMEADYRMKHGRNP
jgi:hypothetical protein